MKLLILIILLVLVIISSNYLLQIKIEHFYENILPEYEQEQNNELIEISENVDNINNTISDVYGISNDAVLQTDDAVKQVEEIRNDISDKMIDINKKYNKMVAKELEETKKRNANINRNNHILVFYGRKGKKSYKIPLYNKTLSVPWVGRYYNDTFRYVIVPKNTQLSIYEYPRFDTARKSKKRRFRKRRYWYPKYKIIQGPKRINLRNYNLYDNISSFKVKKTRNDVIRPTNRF